MKTQRTVRRRGNSLVGLLAVVLIVAIAVIVIFKGNVFGGGGTDESPRADGKGTTVPGLAKAKAQDEVCRSNLGQIRTAIQMQMMTDETPPASLEDLRLGSSFLTCPLGGEPFVYDPSRGVVYCPHPGHEKF